MGRAGLLRGAVGRQDPLRQQGRQAGLRGRCVRRGPAPRSRRHGPQRRPPRRADPGAGRAQADLRAGQAAHTVTVFTDIDCPFCKRFHEQIAQYNAHGIAVDYILFPLVGLHPGADKKSEAIWCSKDRIATFNAAMAGQDPAPATCPNPLAELTHLADSLGINGTPTLIAADGTHVAPEIAMSPDRLAAELDRLAAASAP
ncbi:MAG: DsbC family protein [Dokdonella sp.]|nr:DsbC family protein [Dokdonella sp.]